MLSLLQCPSLAVSRSTAQRPLKAKDRSCMLDLVSTREQAIMDDFSPSFFQGERGGVKWFIPQLMFLIKIHPGYVTSIVHVY